MIHAENGKMQLEGSPQLLLREASLAFSAAVYGFFEVSKKITKTEEEAKKMTEDMLESTFDKIRETAFSQKLADNCNMFESVRREDCEGNVPEL